MNIYLITTNNGCQVLKPTTAIVVADNPTQALAISGIGYHCGNKITIIDPTEEGLVYKFDLEEYYTTISKKYYDEGYDEGRLDGIGMSKTLGG